MNIKQLVKYWGVPEQPTLYEEAFSIRLPLHEAARIRALAEMYPHRDETQIITELLQAALNEVEECFPYVQGQQVVREDEFGDPIYNDDGLTPRYSELKRKHSQQMQDDSAAPD